jgi:hypothetical protein
MHGSAFPRETDAYLEAWDRFAQGDKALLPAVRDGKVSFELGLADALARRDVSAPSRLVFYMVVQVGGNLSANSPLGKAWRGYAAGDFPITQHESDPSYFAADLYAWWKAHSSPAHDLPLLREWANRAWSKATVIPMYERLATYKAKPSNRWRSP